MASATGSLRRPRPRNVAATVAAAATTGLGIVTLSVATRRDPAIVTDDFALRAFVVASVVVVVVATWALRSPHPSAAVGLGVAAAGLWFPTWAAFRAAPDTGRSWVLAAAPFGVVGVAHVLLRWSRTPGDRPPRSLRAVRGLAGAGAAVHLVSFNPFADPGCQRTCVDVRPLVAIVTSRAAASTMAAATVLAAVITTASVLGSRGRGVPRIVHAAGLSALVLLAVAVCSRPLAWSDTTPSLVPLALPPIAGVVLGASMLDPAWRAHRTRAALERLVILLEGRGSVARLSRGILRDVHFAVPGDDAWVDPAGRVVGQIPDGQAAVVVSDLSGPLLRLVVDRPDDVGDAVEALDRAAMLQLQNARLTAVTRARLAEVSESRRRVAAAADAERRRIERDLHDGAQQRLVSAAFHLSLAGGRMRGPPARLAEAEEALHDALANLRRLAHGLFPNVLVTEGLGAALEDLATASEIDTTLDVVDHADLGVGLEHDVATAAYAVVVSVLEYAVQLPSARRARIAVARDDALVVSVTIDAVGVGQEPAGLTDAEDRAGALGGTLTVSSTGSTTRVEVVIPCAS